MFRDGAPIESIEINHGLDTGITFAPGMLPGMVPDYDVMAARVRCNLIQDNLWNAMQWYEKARCVAFFRLERLIALHVDEARADAELTGMNR